MNSICKTDKHGNKFWVIPNTENHELSYIDYGILHREDEPALEYNNGFKAWYINGKCHREDGPALIENDGSKHWLINGEMHREDGPAYENNHSNHILWCLKNKHIKPTNKMMEKYIQSNPDNILKNYRYPLEIQVLAISLKPSVIFNIPYPDPKLKLLYPKQIALRNSGLI